MPDTDEWLEPGDAATRYGVSRRTVERAAAAGHVRTKPNPRRKGSLYNARDMERWFGSGTGATPAEPTPAEPSTELVPPSELLEALLDTQRRLEAAMHEAGRLRGQLEAQQKLLEDKDQRQNTAEAEAERLRRILQRLPWWLKMIWARGE